MSEFLPRRDHIPGLDGLRGIAVLLVLWAHLPADTLGGPLEIARWAVQPGYLGVDLFFVLSGFLVTRILLASKATARPLRNFFVRRALRIFPIYYLLIAILLVTNPGEYLAWAATYTSNFAYAFDQAKNPLRHSWSLSVEEHFYLIWPTAVYFLSLSTSRRVAQSVLVAGSVVCALATVLVVDEPLASALVYRGTMYRSLSLGAGALLAFHEGELREMPSRRFAHLEISACLLGAALIVAGVFLLRSWRPVFLLVGFSLLATSTVALVLFLEARKSVVAGALSTRPLTFVGRVSYGLYLYHYPIFYACEMLPPARMVPLGRVAVGLSGTFLAAILSYYLVEVPLLKLKDRFS